MYEKWIVLLVQLNSSKALWDQRHLVLFWTFSKHVHLLHIHSYYLVMTHKTVICVFEPSPFKKGTNIIQDNSSHFINDIKIANVIISNSMNFPCQEGKLSKIKTMKHMEFSIRGLTPPNNEKYYRDFLLSKIDFWLNLWLFYLYPLKYQKYFHNLAQQFVVEGGRGGIRGKNKSF